MKEPSWEVVCLEDTLNDPIIQSVMPKQKREDKIPWRHFLYNLKIRSSRNICGLRTGLAAFSFPQKSYINHSLAKSDISEVRREMFVCGSRSRLKCGPNCHTSMRVLTICKLTTLILHDNKIKVWQQAHNTAYFKCKTNKKNLAL